MGDVLLNMDQGKGSLYIYESYPQNTASWIA